MMAQTTRPLTSSASARSPTFPHHDANFAQMDQHRGCTTTLAKPTPAFLATAGDFGFHRCPRNAIGQDRADTHTAQQAK